MSTTDCPASHDESSSVVGSASVSSEGEGGRAHSQSSMVLPGWGVLVGDGCGELDKEIVGVGEYLSLGREDVAGRNLVRGNIQMACGFFWKDAVVKKYGSGAYGTSVPSSDIDLVVEGCGGDIVRGFYPFCMELEALGYIRIGEALSPTDAFLKLADPARSRLDINITLTVGRSPSRTIAVKVQKMLEAAPSITPVYKVLRTLLTQCKLKDATKGGLSSYALLMMVFHAANRFQKTPSSSELLTDFLQYYSSEVDFLKVTLAPSGEVLPRRDDHLGEAMSICDFHSPSVNVASSVTKVKQAQSMFKYCALAIEKWDGQNPDYEGYPAVLSTFITTE